MRRILDAVAGATRAAYGDVADYAAFLAGYLNVPLAVAESAIERERTQVALDGELDLTGLTNLIGLQAKLGAIPAGVTPRRAGRSPFRARNGGAVLTCDIRWDGWPQNGTNRYAWSHSRIDSPFWPVASSSLALAVVVAAPAR